MIDWNKHDNATCVSVTTSWADRPIQTKTVADAVEWAKGEWKEGRETIWLTSGGFLEWGCKVTDQTICTRAEFEAYVKEQEGEKWTHITSIDKCRILVDKPDEHGYIVVEMEGDGYSLIPERKLKPIKPTLSESEAWRKAREGYSVEFITGEYNVVEG